MVSSINDFGTEATKRAFNQSNGHVFPPKNIDENLFLHKQSSESDTVLYRKYAESNILFNGRNEFIANNSSNLRPLKSQYVDSLDRFSRQ